MIVSLIVMWRFLRNRRLILRLHHFQGTHILGAPRGGPCDSVASCYSVRPKKIRPAGVHGQTH